MYKIYIKLYMSYVVLYPVLSCFITFIFKSFVTSYWMYFVMIKKKNLDDSIDSGNFSMTGDLPFIQKHSIPHIHDLAVYVKERLENSTESYLCFQLALLHSVSYFYFLY